MISFAGSTPTSVLPQPPVSQSNTPANAPSSEDDSSASFHDVMQQQQDSSTPGQPDQAPTPPSGSLAHSSTTPTAAPTPVATTSAAAPAKGPATPVAPGSDLSSMIIQASVLATNLQQALAAKGVGSPATTATTTPAPAEATDLSTLIAQATALLSGGKAIVTASSPTTTPTTGTDKGAKNSASGTTSAKGSTTTVSSPLDLSTLLAQSTIIAQASTAVAGKELPVSGVNAGAVGSATKEKKSASSSAGGSFLQSGTAASSATSSAFGLMAELQSVLGGATVNQQLTPGAGTKNSSLDSVSAGTTAAAGTANVEKGKAMNSDLNFPELQLLSGNGANAAPAQASPDLSIQLASNHDFSDALTQVMHVAQLADANGSRAPMRVEIEIQTPPGAVVNVYVSKQNDQWRAQLSTNDPAALSWVQDQVSSLRQSGDLGVEVKWLPPQLEGTSTIATSSGQESNLSWNQGGQGQSNYQQPDERQQSGRQTNADDTSEASPSSQFMQTLAALGRAA